MSPNINTSSFKMQMDKLIMKFIWNWKGPTIIKIIKNNYVSEFFYQSKAIELKVVW